MSLIWVICGAGRGVGKTTLALRLCKVLPDSVYAKCGRSSAKTGKPGTFFENLAELESFVLASRSSSKHIIVESNALSGFGRYDIIIFIDGIVGKTNFRKDTEQLRAAADLKICSNATLTDWEKTLAGKLDSKALRKAVCDCLIAQKRYLFGSEPVVRSKVWFESAEAHVFGMGLARLFENINRLGTLQDASKAAGMSYRYAWNLIRMAERHFGKRLIERHAGGADGGSSALSADGRHMLEVFRQLNEEVAGFADERFAKLFAGEKANA
jgi:molybdate transport system regulatory protein